MVEAMRTMPTGLSAAEVRARVVAGRTNAVRTRTSRTVLEILRANVFTVFNALLATLFLLIVLTGRWQNALFGLVIVANSAIGVFQELRAKRTLDRLALLNIAQVRVVRDGAIDEVDVSAVVADDLVEVRSGDQLPADGVVTEGSGLEIDESLLTGESEPVRKQPGTTVQSGSIVVAGSGRFVATAVGADAYATRLATEARRFALTRSELMAGTNRLLRWISVVMLLVGPVLLWSQFASKDNESWQDALTGTVAALVGMVPEGLVLLTSLAFMVGALSLARRQTLVQELPAVEVLARVDVVCLDKTGTLTDGAIELVRVEPLPGSDGFEHALALLTDATDRNATSAAIAAVYAPVPWEAVDRVPFSSARKWSAVTVADGGTWVLGAPEMVLPLPRDEDRHACERADALAAQGYRVLLLAHSTTMPAAGLAEPELPTGLVPVAIVVLAERLRADAGETLRFFAEQGVRLKVISGDNARTVGAVAARVCVPGVSSADDAVDARTLPEDPEALGRVVDEHHAFGRVTPHQKRAMVAALQRRGHVVAMTGDGVNDALALKDADIGIAMGNGSPATRAVAQLVLLDGRFAHLPFVVAEGRRVIANIERAANLFLVKNVYSLALALVVAVTLAAYPLAPIQLTLISTLTIGIPGAVLALGPNQRRYRPGFLHRVLRFAVPTGLITATVAYLGYRATRLFEAQATVAEARTTATLVIFIVSLWTLTILSRPLRSWKLALLTGVAATAVLCAAVPAFGRDVFLLHVTAPRALTAAVLGVAGALLVEFAYRFTRAPARVPDG
jgi:cation-transporting ATPase E